MSEPIPESIPTSTSRLSHRPTKRSKAHHNASAISAQSHSLAVLFANADREIIIPPLPSKTAPTPAPPPEIVPNVQGSSAGAGSGEFHVYKASKRREYERIKAMDEEVKREEGDREWEKKKVDLASREEKRMGKNKARRERAKERKAEKGKGGKDGEKEGKGDSGDGGEEKGGEGSMVATAAAVPEVGLTIHDEDD